MTNMIKVRLLFASLGLLLAVAVLSGTQLNPGYLGGQFTIPWLAPNGSAAAPSYASLNEPDSGLYFAGSGSGSVVRIATNGTLSATFDTASGIYLPQDGGSVNIGASNDTTLLRLAAGTFGVAANGGFGLAAKAWIRTAPTISSGFGTSPSVVASNGSAAFTINVGTGGVATSGVIGLPTATTGWRVTCDDVTTKSSTVYLTKQTATATTTATVGNFDAAGAAAAWAASDILVCSATAY